MAANELPASDTKSISISVRVSRILQDGLVGALATLIEAEDRDGSVGSKLLLDDQGKSSGSLGDEALNAAVAQQAAAFLASRGETRVFRVREFAPDLAEWSEAQVLLERIQAEPRLVICGAGHVGASLAKLASMMGSHATLIDDRAEFVTRNRFPEGNIDLLVADSWTDAVRSAISDGHGVAVAIVTRGHSEDERCLRAVMTVETAYVGLIGSKRRTNIVLQRLRESGADEQRLGKVHAPVGLDIGAVTPEEVALAIMAEIVAVRRGGAGGSLSSWRRETN